MIVQRITIPIKSGKIEEAIKMVKEGKGIWSILPGRFYSVMYGPSNTVVFENEAENQVELDKLWEQVAANEEWATWFSGFAELITEGGTTELWNLEYS